MRSKSLQHYTLGAAFVIAACSGDPSPSSVSDGGSSGSGSAPAKAGTGPVNPIPGTGGAATGGITGFGGSPSGGGGVHNGGAGGVSSGGTGVQGGTAPGFGGRPGSGGGAPGGSSSGGTSSSSGGAPALDCNATMPTDGKDHSGNGQGGAGNLAWQLWANNANNGSITTFSTPAFGAQWNNAGDYLARIGYEWGNAAKTYDAYGTITAQFSYKKTGSGGG